eukprot:3194038-Rhodomonas_salina.1
MAPRMPPVSRQLRVYGGACAPKSNAKQPQAWYKLYGGCVFMHLILLRAYSPTSNANNCRSRTNKTD